jgi:hypothetical protein
MCILLSVGGTWLGGWINGLGLGNLCISFVLGEEIFGCH